MKPLKTQSRLKSKALWVAVAAFIALMFTTFNVWEAIGINIEEYNALVNSILSLLILGGIVNVPIYKNRP